ncbi:MAG: UDP-N-acetylglucosamine--N-acetylmuramyl-(pentapeptide) pyrophosphoryl-undecaprenol N-acetylglucosamine transferase [Planctomycetota bacterium]|nr:UDP-N-acetylglucosamine--N-acetylmuramyl-(pentapeptide) pyrophosphoryl-undecaprenol N-acetylglucosamine transferase [Planctomycetota bacterium]
MNPAAEAPEEHRVLIVGGGSGGHISPGLAVAEALASLGSQCHVICSERAIDSSMLSQEAVSFETVPARPFSTRPSGLLRCLRGMQRSSRHVRQLLEGTKFDCVLALGGFVAAAVMPGISKARSQNTNMFNGPVVLLNLDSVPGKANRHIARQADLILSTVDTVQPRFASSITGLPIRSAALAPGDPEHCRKELGLEPERPVLLVTGASQGAGSVNRLMQRLLDVSHAGLADCQVIHLIGDGGDHAIASTYAQAGIRAIVLPFLDQMGLAWGAASITISRAGANSVGEIQANSVPAIFLPYPHHRDQHQVYNARPLVDAGGAHIVEDQDDQATADTVGRLLADLFNNPLKRRSMSDALAAQARPEAAEAIASVLLAASNITRSK